MANIAIIGGGQGGTSILQAFKNIDKFKLIGVCDVNSSAPGMRLARELGVATFENLDDILQQPGLEIIIEATGSKYVQEQIMQIKPAHVHIVDSHNANIMMTFTEEHDKFLKRARSKKEAFRNSASFLTQTYGKEGVIYYTTNRECYDFVEKHNLEIGGIDVGVRIVQGGVIDRCMKTRQMIAQLVDRKIYGKYLYTWVAPIFEDDDESKSVIGTYGVYVPKVHPVAKAFDVFAPIIIECQAHGAWVGVSDLETLICARGSDKFDLKTLKVGTPMKDNFSTIEIAKSKRAIQIDLDYDSGPARLQGIPLFDEESGNLVGTFAIIYPRNLAYDLQDMASRLNSSSQEMASVMQEIAASAGEICMREEQLADQIKKVEESAASINEILSFTKSVADQTKMLGLNAAIEAARAGEHGRGFGVVAEEIRRLSDQSKQTVEQIGGLIKEINVIVQKAVDSSGNTVKNSQEQAAATQQVTATVMNMAEMAEKLMKVAQTL